MAPAERLQLGELVQLAAQLQPAVVRLQHARGLGAPPLAPHLLELREHCFAVLEPLERRPEPREEGADARPQLGE